MHPIGMTKRKALLISLVFVLLLSMHIIAGAETNPITAKIEINPEKLAQPGPVEVTISVTNTGNIDLTEPVTLFDPAAKPVEDFGDNGQCLLAAGQTETWTGAYNISQNTLNNGAVTYFLKYKTLTDSGETKEEKQVLRAAISQQTAETDITVKRTISPTVAREGQEVVVSYEIKNTGSVALYDIAIQENKAVYKEKQKIASLQPGSAANLKYTVTMGTKDITSGAKITYTSETKKKTQTYTVEDQTIKYGTSKLTCEFTSSSKGVVENNTITLTLKLKNGGTLDYSDIRVTDTNLGNLFVDELTGKELAAGKSLTLEQEVTVPQTTEYQLIITATDATGNEESITTEPLAITTISADDALNLQVNVTADRTEVFTKPGNVRFTIEIINNSNVDATNVVLKHGTTTISNLDTLAAGKTRVLSRDTALSMAGKYQFTVTAKDPLENELSFNSNEIQVVFSVPTPVPATPTPIPEPTPEPTFQPATIPPITDSSVGAVPKAISKVLTPLGWVSGILMLASLVLVILAKVNQIRNAQEDKNALDTLTGVMPRDYLAADDDESTETTAAVIAEPNQNTAGSDIPIERGNGDFVSRYGDDELLELAELTQQIRSSNSTGNDETSSEDDEESDDIIRSIPMPVNMPTVDDNNNWNKKPVFEEVSEPENPMKSAEMKDVFDSPRSEAENPQKRRRRL